MVTRHQELLKALLSHNLTPAESRILNELLENDSSSVNHTLTSIQQSLNMPHATFYRAIKALRARNLIEAKSADYDMRVKHVRCNKAILLKRSQT